MNIRDTWRVQDGFNQRGRYKARVVPFAVIANAEIQHVDIFIAVAWVDIEKKKPLSRINNTTSSQTEPESVSDCNITARVAKSNVHTDKQPGCLRIKLILKRGLLSRFRGYSETQSFRSAGVVFRSSFAFVISATFQGTPYFNVGIVEGSNRFATILHNS